MEEKGETWDSMCTREGGPQMREMGYREVFDRLPSSHLQRKFDFANKKIIYKKVATTILIPKLTSYQKRGMKSTRIMSKVTDGAVGSGGEEQRVPSQLKEERVLRYVVETAIRVFAVEGAGAKGNSVGPGGEHSNRMDVTPAQQGANLFSTYFSL
ncbi:hypothetical protein BC830DRAFT_1133226, partial [Chytriomyces sp. MP71]